MLPAHATRLTAAPEVCGAYPEPLRWCRCPVFAVGIVRPTFCVRRRFMALHRELARTIVAGGIVMGGW